SRFERGQDLLRDLLPRLPRSELLSEERLGGRVDRAVENVEVDRIQEAVDGSAALGREVLGRTDHERLQLLVSRARVEERDAGCELGRTRRPAQECPVGRADED